jgi:TonB family protein
MSARITVSVAYCLFLTASLCLQERSPQEPLPRIVCATARGKIVHMVRPTYPSEARVQHIEGDVVLRLLLGKDGSVKKIKTASGNPMLAAAAEEAGSAMAISTVSAQRQIGRVGD